MFGLGGARQTSDTESLKAPYRAKEPPDPVDEGKVVDEPRSYARLVPSLARWPKRLVIKIHLLAVQSNP